MILSVSRRTDIPCFYADWFFRRMEEGYAMVRNPMNARQISRIPLSPEVVDGIVFWTKNPQPMLNRLEYLKDYPYYFQFTLTPYGADLEPHVPSKKNVMIHTFRELSDRIGPERVIWRYDPILLTPNHTMEYHLQSFQRMARRLEGYTRKCIISFVDSYRKTAKEFAALGISPPSGREVETIAREFSKIATEHHITMETCAEEADLSLYGIGRSSCIDPGLLRQIGGIPLQVPEDKNRRAGCGCAAAVDIGAYDTCLNGCKYCYASLGPQAALGNYARHIPHSPLLTGEPREEDTITHRKIRSHKEMQTALYTV